MRSPHPPLTIPDVSLSALILENAEAFGEKPALIDFVSGRVITYAEFAWSVRSLAAGLLEHGFQRTVVLCE